MSNFLRLAIMFGTSTTKQTNFLALNYISMSQNRLQFLICSRNSFSHLSTNISRNESLARVCKESLKVLYVHIGKYLSHIVQY